MYNITLLSERVSFCTLTPPISTNKQTKIKKESLNRPNQDKSGLAMSDLGFDDEDQISDAIMQLQSKTRGEVLHQGVTTLGGSAGSSTRSGMRRTSEGVAGPSRKTRKKPYSRQSPMRETGMDTEEAPPSQPPMQQAPPLGEGWAHTMLTDIQRTLQELVKTVSTMNGQLQQERQRTSNLELRVESIQQVRMQGLTAQIVPSRSSVPSSGQTPHVGDITEGPLTF